MSLCTQYPKARKREARVRFTCVAGAILPGRFGSAPGVGWRRLEPCSRDCVAGFRYHDPPGGLAFRVVAWLLFRRGFGRSPEEAPRRALSRALKGILRRFNGAELDSVEVRKYPGFYGAKVTLQSRQIQQQASLEVSAADTPRQAVSASIGRLPRVRSAKQCAAPAGQSVCNGSVYLTDIGESRK